MIDNGRMSAALLFLLCFAAPFYGAESNGAESNGAESIPAQPTRFLTKHCADCHTGSDAEADVRFDLQPIDWKSVDSTQFWERVYNAVSRKEMPPSDADQPSGEERKQMVAWLEGKLVEHAKPGGTVLRRLNREEYENSIRDLFDLPEFATPESFPADDSEHGFDNIGETLVLSPPLLAQYLELATQVADEILPPDQGPPVANTRDYDIGATGLAASSITSVEGTRFRIASSQSNADKAGWPALFEAPQSGVYRLKVGATTFQTDKMSLPRLEKPFRLTIYAKQKTEQTYDPFEKIRKVAEFDVLPERDDPQTFECEIELVKGEAFGLRWENGPFYGREYLVNRVTKDRRMHAAMLALGKDPRGMSQSNYYDEVAGLMERAKLDVKDPRLDEELKGLPFGGIGQPGGPDLMVAWFVHEEFRRFGPALDVTDVAIKGPLRLIEDQETRDRKARTKRFLGERPDNATDREYVQSVLRRFLTRAFRRPVSEKKLQVYRDMVMRELTLPSSTSDATTTGRIEDGLHVAVRRALASPDFLYRSQRSGRLDQFDLASRLSYFLTSSPPDDQLFDLALGGELSDPEVLERETRRLLDGKRVEKFVQRFTGQWLGTRVLHDIMPDPRLFFYYEAHRRAMTDEAELFFAEILRENHSIDTFIDPDFSYRNKMLNRIYGGDLESMEMQRVKVERGGRQGGVLGLAGVMMATANGVDTNPVHRGVWLLDNVFGMPAPSPPSNVPAIAPDTNGTTTIRSQLEAHRADASCARCHDRIDPLGMVMENFDPVGRWRDHYPIYVKPADGEEKLKKQFYDETGKGTKDGPVVDSIGVLTDGTRLKDVTELKQYLVENIDVFSTCLTSKLLVYATGRPMSFGDARVVDRIVEDVKSRGNGFRDLIVAMVVSETFGEK